MLAVRNNNTVGVVIVFIDLLYKEKNAKRKDIHSEVYSLGDKPIVVVAK